MPTIWPCGQQKRNPPAGLLLVGIDQEFMDDNSEITVTTEILTLRPGIWHVHFAPTFRIGATGSGALALAMGIARSRAVSHAKPGMESPGMGVGMSFETKRF